MKILPSDILVEKIPSNERYRRRIADSFYRFREDPPLVLGKEEKGFDLRFFGEGYPKYAWQDIPILLELAQSDREMTSRIPSLIISSYHQGQCREGMIALWLIEGMRRKHVELVEEKQTGKKAHPQYYHLPFNPMCVKENLKLKDCENSAEIHQQALHAYQAWWQNVKHLPPEKAALVYPLKDTNIRWFGGGVSFRKNR